MVGYRLSNTVSDFGSVSRGICQTDKDSNLVDVVERVHIERHGKGIAYKEGDRYFPLPDHSVVSMNFWGFTPSFFGFLQSGFGHFLRTNIESPKAEFYIPTVVNDVVKEGKGSVKVLNSQERWFGMTYKEDREVVVRGIRKLIGQGIYPEKLWG
jgi:flavin-dependent dehydrogenase